LAAADGNADGCADQQRGRGREAFDMVVPAAEDRARAEEADSGYDRADNAERIRLDQSAAGVFGNTRHQRVAHADQKRGGAGDEHVGSKARRLVGQLAFEADDAAEQHRESHFRDKQQLRRPPTAYSSMPRSTYPVPHLMHAGLAGAVRAAEVSSADLHAVTDDSALAVTALRRERGDRAFETVEGVLPARHRHIEGLVVIVAALLAFRHVVLH
jgi:hypothetical protein